MKAYCPTCHAWVDQDDTPSGRHQHQPVFLPKLGRDPKPKSYAAIILDFMWGKEWLSTWDLVPVIQSVHVRDVIGDLKEMGWTIDEQWRQTDSGKRYKVWKLVLPKVGQGGLF